jgi:hypothetical protein
MPADVSPSRCASAQARVPPRRFRGLIDGIHIYGQVLQEREIAALALGESIDAIARKPAPARTEIENEVLRFYFLENAAPQEIRETRVKLTALREEEEKLKRSFPTVMVMAESPVRKQTHLLLRGAYDKPGETVEPGVPSALPPLPAGAPGNRLGFAQWLVSPANPLLARVTMNRFWQMYFGTGIVKTVGGFWGTGRMAVASGTARLARHRIRAHWLGHQANAEADRDECGIPAAVERDAGPGAARS